MVQRDQYDPARLERLERRLQVLEDAEAIRNLKARYAALCDSQYDADGIARLFTEDVLWEAPAWAGSRVGRRSETSSGGLQRSFRSPSITA
jgi:SnoaL-like protein